MNPEIQASSNPFIRHSNHESILLCCKTTDIIQANSKLSSTFQDTNLLNQPHTLILAGGGLAGLTLALECARRPFFRDKKIVLIDRDDKSSNDRTWCFWAKEGEPLPPTVHKKWKKCLFYGEGYESVLNIEPYRYHMVRGLDYYHWAQAELAKYPNVQPVSARILEIDALNGLVKTDVGEFQGDWVFNSALLPDFSGEKKGTDAAFSYLLQHFKGWIIETPNSSFDPDAVTFMDYRLEQHGETRFVYVLPLSNTRALVEFTVFSEALCPMETYDAELRRYLFDILSIQDFRIEEEEFGVIPMTDYPLSTKGAGRVINIGTAGGFVKASSGYAFLRTQRKIRAFVDDWERTGAPDPAVMQSSALFRGMDSIMLRVLREGLVSGKHFFSLLFKKLPAPLVFRFLDEDASGSDIIRVLKAAPTWPFLKTAFRQIPTLVHIFRLKT